MILRLELFKEDAFVRGVLVDEQDALALLCDQIAVERFADQAERLLRQVERQLLRLRRGGNGFFWDGRRFRFGLKKPMTYWVLLVRVLPPVAFTIPLYTMFSKVGILNTKLPVLLACVLINVPLIIWFLISFFQDLPEEVEESAKVDGATEWQLFRKIVLPLVAPGIAAVAMLSFMYAWNEYTYTVIFTRTAVNNTVPLALALLNTEDNLTNFGLVAAGGVVSVIPITLFVIFAQNYLISGLSSGAVKE